MKGNVSKYVGIVIAVVFFILGCTLQIPDLSREGCISIFTLLAGVSLWISNAFPLAISGLLCMLVLIVTGAGTANEVVGRFINTAVLFLIFCFAFGSVFKKTSFSKKIVGAIIRVTKGNSTAMVYGVLFITCILSYFMHNLAAIAIMMPIAAGMLETLGQEKLKSNIGKSLMIGIALAAMIGGAGTPIGASMNVLLINMLESVAGTTINFGQWCVVAVPLTLVLTFITSLSLNLCFKPEKFEKAKIDELLVEFNNLPAATGREKAILITLIATIVLMVAGTWIPVCTILNVGLLFLVVATFPGVDFLTWKEIQQDVDWQCFVMFGSVNAMVGTLIATGGVAWLASVLSSAIGGLPVFVILLLFGVITQVLHALCPVGTALASLVFTPFCAIAMATGAFSPAVVVFVCAFSLGVQYIVPVNLPFLITMGTGYWETKDCPKQGVLPAVAMIVLMAVWFPISTGFLSI